MIAYFFIAFGLFIRLIPGFSHSEIGTLYSPVLAIALFSGAYLGKKQSLFIPIIIMAVSDFFIGYYDWKLMVIVYGSFLLTVLLGRRFKRNFIAGSLIGATVYFFVTNFGFWALTPWYTKDLKGLYECFILALPYFKNSIIGTLVYSTIFFGAYELAKIIICKTKKSLFCVQSQ